MNYAYLRKAYKYCPSPLYPEKYQKPPLVLGNR
jgi:hypothetical protein